MLDRPLNGLRDSPKFPINKEYLVTPRRAKNAINTLASLFETAEGTSIEASRLLNNLDEQHKTAICHHRQLVLSLPSDQSRSLSS